jgi:hypothetical protein
VATAKDWVVPDMIEHSDTYKKLKKSTKHTVSPPPRPPRSPAGPSPLHPLGPRVCNARSSILPRSKPSIHRTAAHCTCSTCGHSAADSAHGSPSTLSPWVAQHAQPCAAAPCACSCPACSLRLLAASSSCWRSC